MTVKHFVDHSGSYIGGFEGTEPPDGSVEVHVPPADGRQIWSFSKGAWGGPLLAVVDYEDAIQAKVDVTAKQKLFRDGVTLASYTASTNPQWAAEALAFVAWRDGVWAYAYTELAKVQAGKRQQPTVEEFLAEIEPIEWPAPPA